MPFKSSLTIFVSVIHLDAGGNRLPSAVAAPASDNPDINSDVDPDHQAAKDELDGGSEPRRVDDGEEVVFDEAATIAGPAARPAQRQTRA